jgi:hypothetical protein
MHDDDTKNAVDLEAVEATPIGMLTTEEIMAHLKQRYVYGMVALNMTPTWCNNWMWGSEDEQELLLSNLSAASRMSQE